jgi:hypothetical protein
MFVPSNCQGKQRHRWRPAFAMMSMMLIVALALARTAQAVEFDEKLKAPMMKDAADLRAQARGYSARFAALRDAAPERLLTEAALAREQFNLAWTIQRAIDEKKPLPDLADVGIVPNPNGGVQINSKAFPQWLPLYERISSLLPSWDTTQYGPELIRRGFRESDITLLKEYLDTHDVQRMGAQRALPIALAFNKVVAKYDKVKRPVEPALAISYFYQQALARAESSREWTAELLAVLDPQRTRILIAFFSEFETTTWWTPNDVPAEVADLLTKMRLPDFQQRATAEVQGVQP